MTEAVPRPNDEQRINGSDDRLESWKEIAAYLKRGVRTVQRWEQAEGLPVHRHHHGKRGTVYAFREEIDAWRENRKEDTSSEGAGSLVPAVGHPRGGFAAVVQRISERLRRFLPAHRKRRVLVRIAAWIVLVSG
jgi:hypothetical protein